MEGGMRIIYYSETVPGDIYKSLKRLLEQKKTIVDIVQNTENISDNDRNDLIEILNLIEKQYNQMEQIITHRPSL